MGILLLPGEHFQISFASVRTVMCNHNVRNRIRKQWKCIHCLAPWPWVSQLLSVSHPFPLLFKGKYPTAGIISYHVCTQCTVKSWSQEPLNGTGKMIQSKTFNLFLKPYVLVMMKICQRLRLHMESHGIQNKYSKTKHITSFPLLQSHEILFSSYSVFTGIWLQLNFFLFCYREDLLLFSLKNNSKDCYYGWNKAPN